MNVRVAISLLLLFGAAGTDQNAHAAESPASTIEMCARIESASERLACYDRFSGRPSTTAVPGNQALPAAAPSAAAAQSSVTQSIPAGGSPRPVAPSLVTPTAGAAGSAPGSPQDAFGFYSAEHPLIQTALKSMTATVVDFTADINGHQTLTLDNGQLWQLDGTDALLARGNSITIKRAMLGSFILKTPSSRTYRAQRLR